MSCVIGTSQSSDIAGYKFRQGWRGTQVLQVGFYAQDWDMNTGHEDGQPYTLWRDATAWQAAEFERRVDSLTGEGG